MKEAALAADRWLALNSTSEQAHRYAGMAALRLHRLEKAETEFAQTLETAYISPAAGFLALLPVIGDEGIPTDVTELFRRLVARHPKVAEGHYALGNAALRSENFALALSSAQQATQLAPYWTPAKLLLARATIASGKDDEGLAIAHDLVTAPDSDVATQLDYALMLASTGHDEEARAMLTPYASGKTVIPGAVRSLGAMDLDAGALDAAEKRFEDLLSTGTQTYESLYFLGIVAERRKDAERALRFYTRVVGGDYAMAAQQRVARIKSDQSGLDAGLAHLEEFGRSQPQAGPQVVAARAALASAFRDEKRALEILNDGIRTYPDLLDLRMSRVFLYERTGKADKAIRDLRELLAERPGDAAVQNALGYTLADHGKQLDEAQSLLAAALAAVTRQCGDPRQHGLAAASAGQARGGAHLPAAFAVARQRSGDRPACRRGAVGDGRPGCGAQDVAGRARALPRQRATAGASQAGRPLMRAIAPFLLSALLAGCAATPGVMTTAGAEIDPARVVDWSASGRMAIAVADQGGSGRFDWTQRAATTNLEVRGPLGAGALRIVTDGEAACGDRWRGREAGCRRRPRTAARPPRRGPAARRNALLDARIAGAGPGRPGVGRGLKFRARHRAIRLDGDLPRAFRHVQGWAVPTRLTVDGGGARIKLIVDEWRLPAAPVAVSMSAAGETSLGRPEAWPAPGKLNLFLHIVGRRPDGYHLLQTAFQFIDLCDEIRFWQRPRRRHRAHRRRARCAPADVDLTVRAARLLAAGRAVPARRGDRGARKDLPMQGGVGGGSSDAGTVLVALNELWGSRPRSSTGWPGSLCSSARTCRFSSASRQPGPRAWAKS